MGKGPAGRSSRLRSSGGGGGKGNFSHSGHHHGRNHHGGGGRWKNGAGGSPGFDVSPATPAKPFGAHRQTYGGKYRGGSGGGGRGGGWSGGWPATPGSYNRANSVSSSKNRRGFDANAAAGTSFGSSSHQHTQHHQHQHHQHHEHQRQDGDSWPKDVNHTPSSAAAAAATTGETNPEDGRSIPGEGSVGVRERLASVVGQQTPRRRIEFHPATRPDTVFSTSGASAIGLQVAARTSGDASVGTGKGGGSTGGAATVGGGGGWRAQHESGTEKLTRLADEKIGLPHSEKVFPLSVLLP